MLVLSQYRVRQDLLKLRRKGLKRELILSDSYQFLETPKSIVERFITPVLKVIENKNEVTLEGKQKLRIIYDNSQLELIVKENEFINHSGEKKETTNARFYGKRTEV